MEGRTMLGIDGSTMDGTLIDGIDGSCIVGIDGSCVVGPDGSLMVGIEIVGMLGSTISGNPVVPFLTGESSFVGEFDLDKLILPNSPDRSPSLPSLISVTVEGSLLPVLLSYPSPGRGWAGIPIPGSPRSKLLEATTTTGGLGSGRLLGEPNPIPLSNDLTDEIVSDRSSEGDAGDSGTGREGPASGGAVCVRIGEGSGLVEDGRTVGESLIGDCGL
jgi:hypothetical protein